jgi:hypothetical protein
LLPLPIPGDPNLLHYVRKLSCKSEQYFCLSGSRGETFSMTTPHFRIIAIISPLKSLSYHGPFFFCKSKFFCNLNSKIGCAYPISGCIISICTRMHTCINYMRLKSLHIFPTFNLDTTEIIRYIKYSRLLYTCTCVITRLENCIILWYLFQWRIKW